MLKESLSRKLTSRKFWIASVCTIMGIYMTLFCPEQASQVDGIMLTGFSSIGYLFAETICDVWRAEEEKRE